MNTPSQHSSADFHQTKTAKQALGSPVLGFACLAVAYLPVLWAYLPQLWAREYYRFFPFAIATSIAFANTRLAPWKFYPASRTRWAIRWCVFAVVVCLAVGGALVGSPLIGFSSFALATGLLLDLFADREANTSLAYCILPILLLIRPPLYLDALLLKLQLLTSQFSSRVLNAMGIDHILEGNIIESLIGGRLGVAEACSGIQSLFTVAFIAAFMIVARRYTQVRSIALLSASVFLALGMNVFRVTAIAIEQVKYQLDLTAGWRHDAVGYVGMLLAVILLLSADRFLAFFLSGVPDDSLKNPAINYLVSLWNYVFGTIALDVNSDPGVSAYSAANSVNGRRAFFGVIIVTLITALPYYFGLSLL